MKQNKNLSVVTVTSLIVLIVLFAGCTLKQTPKKIDCTALKQDFDNYVERSPLPIIENTNSLCYGLYVGSNFSNLSPKWAVGKIIEVDNELQVQGFNKTEPIYSLGFYLDGESSLNKNELVITKSQVGDYYKIDMNNMCRYFFMMADDIAPSPISSTFVKPEKINCEVN